jgi:hypothetical protein
VLGDTDLDHLELAQLLIRVIDTERETQGIRSSADIARCFLMIWLLRPPAFHIPRQVSDQDSLLRGWHCGGKGAQPLCPCDVRRLWASGPGTIIRGKIDFAPPIWALCTGVYGAPDVCRRDRLHNASC